MSPNQLREWLFHNNQEDQWWICLDSVTEERPVTVAEIIERLKYGQYVRAQALHVSQTSFSNPPWVDVETTSPLKRVDLSAAHVVQTPSSATERLPRSRRRRYVLIGAGGALLLYLVSPYYSLWRFRSALASGSVNDLEARIDFPSVRESLKDQIRVRAAKSIAEDKSLKDNPFGGIATAFAPMMVNYFVDNFVTPSGISAVIADSKTALDGANSQTASNEEKKTINWSRVHYAFFTTPTQFRVDIDGTNLHFGFTGFGWTLKKLELPPADFSS